MNTINRVGYVRLSRNSPKSLSVENQVAALKRFDRNMSIFVDKGVSGESNLSDPNSQWFKKVRPILQSDPTVEVVVFTLDRLSRKKGAMLYELENILDGGGSIHCVRDGKTYTDADDAGQAVELLFASYQADAYRVEGQRKTQVAIDALKASGVPLGRKPSLTEDHMNQIRALRELGLGYTAIGKAVRTPRKSDGTLRATAPRTVKQVLAGEYESREAFEARDLKARQEMAARAVLRGREAA